MEKIYNKLVRDKIPEIIKKDNSIPVYRILSDNEYLKELENKLTEECKEVIDAKKEEDKIKELADVIEVVSAMAKVNNKTLNDIIKIADEKKKDRGGFDKKYFLEKEIQKKI